MDRLSASHGWRSPYRTLTYLEFWQKRPRQSDAGACDKPFMGKFSSITLGYMRFLRKMLLRLSQKWDGSDAAPCIDENYRFLRHRTDRTTCVVWSRLVWSIAFVQYRLALYYSRHGVFWCRKGCELSRSAVGGLVRRGGRRLHRASAAVGQGNWTRPWSKPARRACDIASSPICPAPSAPPTTALLSQWHDWLRPVMSSPLTPAVSVWLL